MNKFLNKVLCIDGSYMIHRALHVRELFDLMTETGYRSGGIFGFLRMLSVEIRNNIGYYPIVCWDSGQSQRRLDLHPNYKHHADHQEAPPTPGSDDDKYIKTYHDQRSALISILKSLGIPSLKVPKYEGDDLMYILTKCSDKTIIVSDDKDMIQLVDENVDVSRTMNKEFITYESADDYYKHPEFIIRKAIVGDGSDNIPKVVAGVGEKAASDISKYIKDSYTLDYSKLKDKLIELSNSNEKVAKKATKVLDNYDQFIINMKLMDLRQVEIPENIEYIVNSSIRPILGKANFLEASSWLGKYEIRTIDLNKIIGNLVPYVNSVII